MVFEQKCPFLEILFFYCKIGQENVFYDILQRKNAFLASKKQKIKKSKNRHFSQGVNPRFWFKNGQLFIFCFLGNIGQENVFYEIPRTKKHLSRL